MPINYYVWGAIVEHCQRYMPKLTNITKLKDCFVDDMEMICCKSSLILRQSCNFNTDFDHVLLQVDILSTLIK